MVLFCFIFYTLVTVLFLILCIGEHKADAKVVYAAHCHQDRNSCAA